MELVSSHTSIPFMRFRPLSLLFSLALIAGSFFFWFEKGDEKFSIDFVGGSEVVVLFEAPIDTGAIRSALTGAGFPESVIVQTFGEDVLERREHREYSIRLKAEENATTAKAIRRALKEIDGNSFELLKEDFVGPVIGEQIRRDGITALVIALIGILIYITVRFEMRFALGAIVALLHDVIITTGVFVFTGREISAAVLAALLTIVGYSLNDTIIVYDRIRENFGKALKASEKKKKAEKKLSLSNFVALVNTSINQTLSRTMLTSLTTLFVVSTLWLLGGGAVSDLAFALVIGVAIGTYSSIFVACPVILFGIGKKKN